MSKINLAIGAILLLFATASCETQRVEPDDQDTTKTDPKGWNQLQDYPGTGLRWASGFSLNNKGYVVGGQYEKPSDGNTAHVFEYNPSTDQWKQLNDYPGKGMGLMAGFSIGTKIFLGTGFNYGSNLLQNDFWEYDASTDSWIQKADVPGANRQGAMSFAINGEGYILGNLLKTKQDLWKHTPSTNQWSQMNDYPGLGTAEMIGASVSGKAYVGGGANVNEVMSDFWEYDPSSDKWIKKADLLEPLYNAVVFTKGSRMFVIGGIGQDLKFRKSVLVYDTATDQWTKTEDFKGQERSAAVGFVIGETAYYGIGAGSKTAGGATYPVPLKDFWKFKE